MKCWGFPKVLKFLKCLKFIKVFKFLKPRGLTVATAP